MGGTYSAVKKKASNQENRLEPATKATNLVAGVDADGETLRQLQEGHMELLRLPRTVAKVAISVVPRHAHLARLESTGSTGGYDKSMESIEIVLAHESTSKLHYQDIAQDTTTFSCTMILSHDTRNEFMASDVT